jgi:hypothetical protein
MNMRVFSKCRSAWTLLGVTLACSWPAWTQTAQDTTALATAAGFLDIAGIKLGMPVQATQAVLKGLNPAFKGQTNTVVVWPTDANNPSSQQYPADAPKSVNSIEVMALDAQNNREVVNLTAALHPNPAVVIGIFREVNYSEGSGPALQSIVDAVRQKYGKESAIVAQMDTAAFKQFRARWIFDRSGKLLQGAAAQPYSKVCAAKPAGINDSMCVDLTVMDVMAEAAGNGELRRLVVEGRSNPLANTANATTQAFLRDVVNNRAKAQSNEAKQRAVPKL